MEGLNAKLAGFLILFYAAFLGLVTYTSIVLFYGIYSNNFTIVTWVLNSANPSSNVVRSIFIHAGMAHLAGNLFATVVFVAIAVVIIIGYEYKHATALTSILVGTPLPVGILANVLYYLNLRYSNPSGTGALGESGVAFALQGILLAVLIDSTRPERVAAVTRAHPKIDKKFVRWTNYLLVGMVALIAIMNSIPALDPHVDYGIHLAAGVIGFTTGGIFVYIENLGTRVDEDRWYITTTGIIFTAFLISTIIAVAAVSLIPW